MGTVWGAYDEVLGRDVAVKEVILPYGLTDEERDTQYQRTFREARTAARLAHPGVISVYDVVEEDDRPWIIMELVRARSLDKVIKKDGPLEWRRVAGIARQMLSALHAAHEAGVLHRDVKPSNVLLAVAASATPGTTYADRAVLTDFGIATSVGDTTLTTTGLVLGSPAYIAPERARGRTVGPASDLWSLGVTIYAMLHGKSPFERAEPMASLVAIISDDPEPLEAAGPLALVIEGLLCKDPVDRLTASQAGLLLDDIVRADILAEQFTLTLDLPAPGLPAVLDPPEPTTHGPGAADAGELASADEVASSQEPPSSDSSDSSDSSGPPEDESPVSTSTDPGLVPLLSTVRTEVPPAKSPRSPGAGRPAVVWAAIAAVAVLLIGGIVLLLNSGGTKAHPAISPTPKASSPTSSGSPSPSSTGIVVPTGFRLYQDSSGAAAVIPKSWTDPSQWGNGSRHAGSPDGQTRIEFYRGSGSGSALDALKSHGDDGHSQYHQVKAPAGVTGGRFADPSGAKAAELEYTWQSNSGKEHVLRRDIVVDGHIAELLIQGPAASWDSTIKDLQPVLDSYGPTP